MTRPHAPWLPAAMMVASTQAPYVYARLVFAAALGTWIFGDVIAPSTVTSVLLIVGSNLALFWGVGRTRAAKQ